MTSLDGWNTVSRQALHQLEYSPVRFGAHVLLLPIFRMCFILKKIAEVGQTMNNPAQVSECLNLQRWLAGNADLCNFREAVRR